MEEKKLNPICSGSVDITKENKKKLKEIFPEAFTENKIDFEKLRILLGDSVENEGEKYSFTWNGKTKAIQLAQQPTVATLKPNKTKSKNWDKTHNVYIEGDNLEVLKILQKSYFNKIKLIYIDPPYNTGSDFIYDDSYSDSIKSYLEQTGQVDSNGNKLKTNTETSGKYHTKWLNMMYPRLELARNMLCDTGVIFISIDDNEQGNLRKICDEIFGEKNLITQIAHKSRASVSNDKIISQNHNFILLYAKNINLIYEKRSEIGLDPDLTGFSNPDNDPRGPWKGTPVDGPGGAKKGNPYYEFLGIKGYYRYSKETMENLLKNNLIVKTKNGIQKKFFLEEAKKSRKTDTSWWNDGEYTTNATINLIDLMGEKTFDAPKPVKLIKRMLKLFTNNDKVATVLDFFSGSGTTAEAVMRMNAEDGGNRHFIMIQLPEQISKKEIAYKDGYRTIPDIAEERIRRAGDKILKENPLFSDKIDVGFKVFELSESNIKKWNTKPKDIVSQLELMKNNFEKDAEPIDIVYEIMLKQGLDLSYPISKVQCDGVIIYDIAFGAMFVVLGDQITRKVVGCISEQISKDEAENSVIVLEDEKFCSDSEKLNIIERLNEIGIQYDDIFCI